MDIYKCPILKKGLRELKFQYIITLSASALPILRGYLYALKNIKNIIQIRALSRGANNRWIFIKDGAKYGECLFVKQTWVFFGMFLIFSAIGLGGFSDDGPKWAMLFYGCMVPIKHEMLQIREKCGNSLYINRNSILEIL
jgi:hypothetical protein